MRLFTFTLSACTGMFFCVPSVGAQSFIEVAETVGINDFWYDGFQSLGGGMAWFDFDGDLDDDLYLCGGNAADRLYRNNGDGAFSDISDVVNLYETSIRNTEGVVTGDIDNDGDRDILVTTRNAGTTLYLQRNLLFENQGDTLVEIGEAAGLGELKFAMPPSFVDLNGDSYLDIYIGNYLEDAQLLFDGEDNVIGFDHVCYADDIYLNNGDLTFTKVDASYFEGNTGCTLAVLPTDANNDGNTDIMVANDFGEWTVPNRLFSYNDLSGNWEDLAPSLQTDIGIYGMGLAGADFDHDLDMDYYCTNLGANSFLVNEGGSFTESAELLGISNEYFGNGYATGWGCFFFDYNNNGWQDLYVANGFISAVSWLGNDQAQSDAIYRNVQGDIFQNVTESILPQIEEKSRGAAYSDFNNDGLLDFGVQMVKESADWIDVNFRLYESQGNPGNYMQLKLRGVTCNRDAFGAKVIVYNNGQALMQELQSSSSHMSQNTSVLHFGLGLTPQVDSVRVHWPGAEVQKVNNLELNALNYIVQDTTKVLPPDTTSVDDINWIISLPAGEGLIYPDNQKKGTGIFDVALFPNPAEETIGLGFALEQSGMLDLNILDMSGRMVHHLWSGKIDEGNHEMQFNRPLHLAAGAYLLCLEYGQKVRVLRLQLQNP